MDHTKLHAFVVNKVEQWHKFITRLQIHSILIYLCDSKEILKIGHLMYTLTIF